MILTRPRRPLLATGLLRPKGWYSGGDRKGVELFYITLPLRCTATNL